MRTVPYSKYWGLSFHWWGCLVVAQLHGRATTPLVQAVTHGHAVIVSHLLSAGADANADMVMYTGAYYGSAALLRCLIAAGGDVNRASGGDLPLFTVIDSWSDVDGPSRLHALLAVPDIDLTLTKASMTPPQYARYRGKPAMADVLLRSQVRCCRGGRLVCMCRRR